MLKIRHDQYAALKEAYRELYVDRTRDYFRRNWPRETDDMDDEQLRDMIRDARDRAEGYGISIEADVVRFTEIRLVLGEDFDRSPDYPWASAVLSDDDTDGTIKVEQLAGASLEVLDSKGKRA
jgi:hypothetical protein